ncbi:MAG: histidine--tRNA ligase [Promethearchaeota archaeon]
MFSRNPLRGMTDYYPDDLRVARWVEGKVRAVVAGYGYEEFEAPLLEPVEIYEAKSSEELVNEQSFIVEKKAGERLILRPELTPSLARMVARKFNELPKPIRWFSNPTCYRYERPQRGRRREFKQFNVDILGEDSLLAEVEVFCVVVDVMEAFGVTADKFQIYYNNRRLVDEILTRVLAVPESKVHAAYKILDRRDKMDEGEFRAFAREYFADPAVEDGLARFSEFSDLEDPPFSGVPGDFAEGRGYREVRELQSLLDEVGIAEYCSFQPGVIRGLDYYTGTVFEVFDTGEENRRALFGGGRYDDLMGLFSKQKLSGFGFGMGLVPFELFLRTYGKIPEDAARRDWSRVVYVVPLGAGTQVQAIKHARVLRNAGIACYTSFSGKNLGKALGEAARLGSRVAVIAGARELEEGKISVKDLSANEQITIPVEDLLEHVKGLLEER